MTNPIATKIFSTLGNNSSLIPLGIKDISNTLGMTAGSYATGSNVEGKDRFIDEAGTQVIWLLGIPFFKKVIDKTVYKIAKLNPDIDVRLLNDKNKDIFKKAREYASPELKKDFDRVLSKEKLFKNLALSKFAVATALTLASYSALTIFRHKHTEKTIIEELKKEEQAKKEKAAQAQEAKSENPSFGMNLAPLKQFMFDPVKNTMIVDGGITAERLAESRNPQDFMGYIVKEGGFWVSMYLLGPWVQKKLEEHASKKNKPIDLDIRVLQDNEFKNAIKDGSIKKHLETFDIKKSDVELYDSLFKNSDNLIVKMMKKAEIIKTEKEIDINKNWFVKKAQKCGLISTKTENNKIDVTQFIDLDAIKGTAKEIGFKQKVENFCKAVEGKNVDEFFDSAVKLKNKSILKNIGTSIGALGIIVPGIMVAMRFMDKDNKEFAVKKQIHEKLKKDPKFAGEV